MPPESDTPSAARAPRPQLRGPFGGKAVYLCRIFGVDVGLDYSWIVIFVLVTVSLSTTFTQTHENWPWTLAWATGLATSLLFFLSILLHELGHSVVSNGLGLPIHSITLFIFGGVARLTREPDRPRDEFLIAIAGPLVSVFLGVGFFVIAGLVPEEPLGVEAIHTMVQWLGRINFMLVIFNCIPGFPLDGGRVLRSYIWAVSGSYEKATRWAAAGGAAFAYFLILSGILVAFLATGGFFSGLWLAFIGWFLLNAARSSVTQMVVKESLEGVPVSEVYDDHCARVAGSMSVSQLIEGPILRQGRRTFFVETHDQVMGLVTLQEVKKVGEDERDVTPIQAIAAALDTLHCVSPYDTLWKAFRQMDEASVNQLPVVEDGHLLGVLTRESVLRVIRNRLELR